MAIDVHIWNPFHCRNPLFLNGWAASALLCMLNPKRLVAKCVPAFLRQLVVSLLGFRVAATNMD
jgi:hypothetical protein